MRDSLMQRLDDLVEELKPGMEMMDTLQQIAKGTEAIRTFQEGTLADIGDIPLLPVIENYEDNTNIGCMKRVAYRMYLVHFICPVCGCKAGSGYKLALPKYYFVAFLKVFKLSLLAVQLAVRIGGLPVDLSTVINGCAVLSETFPEIDDMVKKEAGKLLADALGSLNSKVDDAFRDAASSSSIVSQMNVSFSPQEYATCRPRISTAYIALIKNLLKTLKLFWRRGRRASLTLCWVSVLPAM
jgi:hypothetical protein